MKYHDEALKIYELRTSLENISTDDKKPISEYTQTQVVDEAKWVLNNFLSYGCSLNEKYSGDEGPEAQREAKQEVAALKRFIKKYS